MSCESAFSLKMSAMVADSYVIDVSVRYGKQPTALHMCEISILSNAATE